MSIFQTSGKEQVIYKDTFRTTWFYSVFSVLEVFFIGRWTIIAHWRISSEYRCLLTKNYWYINPELCNWNINAFETAEDSIIEKVGNVLNFIVLCHIFFLLLFWLAQNKFSESFKYVNCLITDSRVKKKQKTKNNVVVFLTSIKSIRSTLENLFSCSST